MRGYLVDLKFLQEVAKEAETQDTHTHASGRGWKTSSAETAVEQHIILLRAWERLAGVVSLVLPKGGIILLRAHERLEN